MRKPPSSPCPVQLRFGAYLKDEPEEDQGGVRTYQAVSAIVHESFTVDDNFDIALVLVETALTGRKTIRLPAGAAFLFLLPGPPPPPFSLRMRAAA